VLLPVPGWGVSRWAPDGEFAGEEHIAVPCKYFCVPNSSRSWIIEGVKGNGTGILKLLSDLGAGKFPAPRFVIHIWLKEHHWKLT
jgi:hypothetical protein